MHAAAALVAAVIVLIAAAPRADAAGLKYLASVSMNESTGPFGVLGGLFFDSDKGRLYVTDATNGRILAYDKELEFIAEFKGAEGLVGPTSLVRDSRERIWVSQPVTGQLLVIDLAAKSIANVDFSAVSSSNPIYPGSLDIDNDDFVYMVDRGNQRVLVFDSNLRYVREVQVEGQLIRDVKIGSDGTMYTLNTGDGHINVFGADGGFKFKFGGRNANGRFSFPVSLAIAKGAVYVLDEHKNTIFVFNARGEYMHQFSRDHWMGGGMHFPSYIDADKEGRLYVIDQQNARISIFE